MKPLIPTNIIDLCIGYPTLSFDVGETVLNEGDQTGILYVLIDGCVEITKQGLPLNKVSEPGAIFGEVSSLLNTPHMATVKAMEQSSFYIIDNAKVFMRSNPEFGVLMATILAQRLSSVTAYLTGVRQSLDQLMRQQTAGKRPVEQKKPLLHSSVGSAGQDHFVGVLRVGPFQRSCVSAK